MSSRPSSTPRALSSSTMGSLAAKTFLPSYSGRPSVMWPPASTWVVWIESVLDAGVEVVGAVGGSGVNGSGALVHGDVIGQHAEDVAVEEGMGEDGALQFGAGEGGENVDAPIFADAESGQ